MAVRRDFSMTKILRLRSKKIAKTIKMKGADSIYRGIPLYLTKNTAKNLSVTSSSDRVEVIVKFHGLLANIFCSV